MEKYLEKTPLPLIKMSFCPPSAKQTEAVDAEALCHHLIAAVCCSHCALSQGSVPVWQGGFCSWCVIVRHCPCGSVSDPQPSTAECAQQAHQNLSQSPTPGYRNCDCNFGNHSPPTSPVLSLPSHSLF